MKRFLAILLSCALVLSGCSAPAVNSETQQPMSSTTSDVTEATKPTDAPEEEINFSDLSDPALLEYVEENVYVELVNTLNSSDYLVENVSAVYISNEYLEEVAYNSQANIYFGYTLEELDEYFQGNKYVFTLGEDGQTAVKLFEAYDDTYDRVIKNVAIGTGVILVCVTVSAVTAVGAPAVSLIFAASAKSGTIFALSSGTFSALAAGVVTGLETQVFDEAMKAAALAGSEGFKWGAITGVFDGGLTQTMALKGATLNGLTMNQAAMIQKESGLPLEFIKSFHSVDEYNVYKAANLQLTKVNGKWAYTQPVDWDLVDSKGRTNYERVEQGINPIDSTGKSFEVHHIGQMADSPLAIMTNSQHHGNYNTLHANTGSSPSNIDRDEFELIKQAFWKAYRDMTYTGA